MKELINLNVAPKKGWSAMVIIGCLFVLGKLVGFVDWPWWLVLFPFYFPWLLVGTILALLLVCVMLAFIHRFLEKTRLGGEEEDDDEAQE